MTHDTWCELKGGHRSCKCGTRARGLHPALKLAMGWVSDQRADDQKRVEGAFNQLNELMHTIDAEKLNR